MCLRSRAWRDVFSVDRGKCRTQQHFETKIFESVSDVRRGFASFGATPMIKDDIDVDRWYYQTFRERPFVAA